jgi:hypothetical protein
VTAIVCAPTIAGITMKRAKKTAAESAIGSKTLADEFWLSESEEVSKDVGKIGFRRGHCLGLAGSVAPFPPRSPM